MSDRFDHLSITAADFAQSLAFYRDVLGWKVVDEWPDRGSGRGAVLSGGGIRVMLRERDSPAAAPSEMPRIHLDIHDLDARYRALGGHAHVTVPPQDTQWGTRWFVVTDPDGNLIAFEELHARGT